MKSGPFVPEALLAGAKSTEVFCKASGVRFRPGNGEGHSLGQAALTHLLSWVSHRLEAPSPFAQATPLPPRYPYSSAGSCTRGWEGVLRDGLSSFSKPLVCAGFNVFHQGRGPARLQQNLRHGSGLLLPLSHQYSSNVRNPVPLLRFHPYGTLSVPGHEGFFSQQLHSAPPPPRCLLRKLKKLRSPQLCLAHLFTK